MPLSIEPSGAVLGATVRGLDLSRPLADAEFAAILRALGDHGVLRFPDQRLDPPALRDLSARFGRIQGSVTGRFHHRDAPEVGILSNIVENGEPVGIADAGQDWHTDMSYTATRGFLNVLYAVRVPVRDGVPLGDTLFANTVAAAADLPAEVRARLSGLTARHDFNKFWERMRHRPGSLRAPLTPEQRAKRPPAVHPVLMRHPISGRTILYANPGYTERILELEEDESARLLDFLFAHQLQARYRWAHRWTEGDLLVWDHLRTIHNAVPDYDAARGEHRLMWRCQVMAETIADPDFRARWLEAA